MFYVYGYARIPPCQFLLPFIPHLFLRFNCIPANPRSSIHDPFVPLCSSGTNTLFSPQICPSQGKVSWDSHIWGEIFVSYSFRGTNILPAMFPALHSLS